MSTAPTPPADPTTQKLRAASRRRTLRRTFRTKPVERSKLYRRGTFVTVGCGLVMDSARVAVAHEFLKSNPDATPRSLADHMRVAPDLKQTYWEALVPWFQKRGLLRNLTYTASPSNHRGPDKRGSWFQAHHVDARA